MSDSQSHPIKMENGNWARSNQQKEDLFLDFLFKTFPPYKSCDADLLINDSLLETKEFYPYEVTQLIASLKQKKAAHFD